MRKPKLKSSYDFLSNDTLALYAHGVVQQTTTSPYFSKGAELAAPVQTAVAALDAAVAETAHPSPSQTAARDAIRITLRDALGALATRLNLDFIGQEAALLSSGLELVQQAAAAAHADDLAPTDVSLVDAPQAGFLVVRFKRPANAVQTLIRYTTDGALPEEQWLVAVGGRQERVLGPFRSGQRVGVKVAALAAGTTEADYAAVVWRIVQ
jgi:hypothetical protein